MKEHIKTLSLFYAGSMSKDDARLSQALTAAIDLMNAAEPMDEAAEREHCVCVASLIWNGPCSAEAAVETLMRERAAADAAGYVRCAEAEHIFKAAQRKTIEALETQLSTAQAEIERLKTRWREAQNGYDDHVSLCRELATKLSAAESRIAELEKQVTP